MCQIHCEGHRFQTSQDGSHGHGDLWGAAASTLGAHTANGQPLGYQCQRLKEAANTCAYLNEWVIGCYDKFCQPGSNNNLSKALQITLNYNANVDCKINNPNKLGIVVQCIT